jgi:hypothetical protein
MTRPLPSYLAVMPSAGKRFRRPRKPAQVAPLPRDGEAVAGMIRQAERVQAIVERLHKAIYADDTLVVRALSDRLEIESRFAASLARGLREGTLCG